MWRDVDKERKEEHVIDASKWNEAKRHATTTNLKKETNRANAKIKKIRAHEQIERKAGLNSMENQPQ